MYYPIFWYVCTAQYSGMSILSNILFCMYLYCIYSAQFSGMSIPVPFNILGCRQILFVYPICQHVSTAPSICRYWYNNILYNFLVCLHYPILCITSLLSPIFWNVYFPWPNFWYVSNMPHTQVCLYYDQYSGMSINYPIFLQHVHFCPIFCDGVYTMPNILKFVHIICSTFWYVPL